MGLNSGRVAVRVTLTRREAREALGGDLMTESTLPALACAFPPSRDLPAYARRAKHLGYERVWVNDGENRHQRPRL
jgi:hypothetical protein